MSLWSWMSRGSFLRMGMARDRARCMSGRIAIYSCHTLVDKALLRLHTPQVDDSPSYRNESHISVAVRRLVRSGRL